jgi:tetratricopeptide (TPR) repeat protein
MSALGRQVVFSGIGASLTPDVKTMVQQKISALQAALQKNPADFDSWINLGIYQKMAGDYTATVISWQYAGKLSPTNFISFGDLGDLSAYFLKDTVAAEKYYAQAIKNGPTQAYLYVQLAHVENEIEHDTAKALATVNAGLAKIPSDPNLLQYKAELSK